MENLCINNLQELATTIKDKRKEQGLTQEELAGLAATGTRFIIDLEKAKATCEIAKVFSVMRALGLRLELNNE